MESRKQIRLVRHIPFQDGLPTIMPRFGGGFFNDLLEPFVQGFNAGCAEVDIDLFGELARGCGI
jgi:hypothetical protein